MSSKKTKHAIADDSAMDVDHDMNGTSAADAKAAKKAAKAAAKAALAEEVESTLRDGKVLHSASSSSPPIKKSPRIAAMKSPKLTAALAPLDAVKKSPRLAAMKAPEETNGSSKPKKESKKRKADEDVQAPEEEERAINSKKTKKEDATPAAAAASSNPKDVPDEKGNPPLTKFNVSPENIKALHAANITHMFPIQAATFDIILAGNDVVGRARTGTGKTLAFALPVIERLLNDLKTVSLPHGRAPRVLVLTPTRELAMQIQKTFDTIKGSKLQTTCVYGGTAYYTQESALRKGMDIVIGTCGRIKDLIEKGTLRLEKVAYVILDEADEMLNMGFADDVELILSNVPRGDAADGSSSSSGPSGPRVQTLLFSATMPSWVENVARKYLRPDRKNIDLIGNTQQHANADITHYAMACHWSERNSVLGEVIQCYGGKNARVIIFTETKKEANELLVEKSIKGACAALHGDIPQAQRETTLKGFRDGKFPILIATDVAARGLDITGVELVLQCEPPEKAEDYIHRSGRTGRAGKKGVCITFYTPKQLYYIQNIETRAKIKMTRVPVPQQTDMIKSSISQATTGLLAVKDDVIPYFLEAAKTLLSDAKENGKSKEEILALALAKIAGFTEAPKKRSLLTSASGMITVQVQMQGGGEIRSLSFIWSLIRRYIMEDCDEKVKGIRLLADKSGAVFDVPAEYEKQISEVEPQDKRVKFTIPTVLPELPQLDVGRPEPKWRGQRSGGGGGGGRGGGGRSGGGGGRGGGGFRGGRR